MTYGRTRVSVADTVAGSSRFGSISGPFARQL